MEVQSLKPGAENIRGKTGWHHIKIEYLQNLTSLQSAKALSCGCTFNNEESSRTIRVCPNVRTTRDDTDHVGVCHGDPSVMEKSDSNLDDTQSLMHF